MVLSPLRARAVARVPRQTRRFEDTSPPERSPPAAIKKKPCGFFFIADGPPSLPHAEPRENAVDDGVVHGAPVYAGNVGDRALTERADRVQRRALEERRRRLVETAERAPQRRVLPLVPDHGIGGGIDLVRPRKPRRGGAYCRIFMLQYITKRPLSQERRRFFS